MTEEEFAKEKAKSIKTCLENLNIALTKCMESDTPFEVKAVELFLIYKLSEVELLKIISQPRIKTWQERFNQMKNDR